jgi:hypothetical protein
MRHHHQEPDLLLIGGTFSFGEQSQQQQLKKWSGDCQFGIVKNRHRGHMDFKARS